MFDRHKKFGLGSGACAQVSDFFTVGLADCSWGVRGIGGKMPQLGPLAVVVSRNVEMRSVGLREANSRGNMWFLQILFKSKDKENTQEMGGLVFC